ncbi:FAD-binding oxidoreductase [Nonomuraea endophytica]|uniref:FAD/FMN-containing dehydrogenase n=1 Tax=Nonomuraea endophytica TaxID=714136 RepID=A0A7W8EJT0_9ACTN|nr:FAD-binding oxidoreductase [Nonomuraea endophytica]MBB5081984.1 FAD/FMN-containing dehydrogenase [Nonomuraea endophytica]
MLSRRTIIKGAGAALAAGSAVAPRDPGDRLAARLGSAVKGTVLFPRDPGFAAEHAGYNPVVRHAPKAVVVPADAGDVRGAVRVAALLGLPVAVQATGHGISAAADGGILINTRLLSSVRIDPAKRIAKVSAGARMRTLVQAAAAHGLATINGSSLDVGAVGYTLGGGLGPLGRKYGYAADHVRAIDLITPDGRPLRLSPKRHADLFWAVRGGKSNFGVVTELEIDLVRLATVYGGALFFFGDAAQRVARAYPAWAARLPEEMTTTLAFMRLPKSPSVPPPLQERVAVRLTAAYLGRDHEARRLLAPMLAAGPELNTMGTLPYEKIGTISNDPPVAPLPVYERTGLLRTLDAAVVERLLALAGPSVKLPFGVIELRQLGGAFARPAAVPNAVGHRDAAGLLFIANPAPASAAASVRKLQQGLMDGLKPHLTGGMAANFMSSADLGPEQVRAAYTPADYKRLTRLKRVHDPLNLFRVNHNIRPA